MKQEQFLNKLADLDEDEWAIDMPYPFEKDENDVEMREVIRQFKQQRIQFVTVRICPGTILEKSQVDDLFSTLIGSDVVLIKFVVNADQWQHNQKVINEVKAAWDNDNITRRKAGKSCKGWVVKITCSKLLTPEAMLKYLAGLTKDSPVFLPLQMMYINDAERDNYYNELRLNLLEINPSLVNLMWNGAELSCADETATVLAVCEELRLYNLKILFAEKNVTNTSVLLKEIGKLLQEKAADPKNNPWQIDLKLNTNTSRFFQAQNKNSTSITRAKQKKLSFHPLRKSYISEE